MADFKHQMYRHLHSARQWLTRAEEAFDKDSDIQGELNLFLAQAEIKHLQEVKQSPRQRYFLLRHGTVLLLAMFITATGMGGYLWMSHRQATKPAPFSAQEVNIPNKPYTGGQVASPVPPKETAVVNNTAPEKVQAGKSAAAKEIPTNSVRQEEQMHQTDKVSVSPDEKQKLIREAGKSLRGQ